MDSYRHEKGRGVISKRFYGRAINGWSKGLSQQVAKGECAIGLPEKGSGLLNTAGPPRASAMGGFQRALGRRKAVHGRERESLSSGGGGEKEKRRPTRKKQEIRREMELQDTRKSRKERDRKGRCERGTCRDGRKSSLNKKEPRITNWNSYYHGH